MQLTKQRKKDTGAFYTPPFWANLAMEYMRKALPLPLEKYVFYDPAGGEGALLEALPESCERYSTTLEYEDVEIMKSKGIKAWQYDFLDNPNINELPNVLFEAARMQRLVAFTNPPFVKLPVKPRKTYAHEKYEVNDSIYCFYYRLVFELGISYLCSFNKPLGKPSMYAHNENIFIENSSFLGGFVSRSKELWELSGDFGIDFNMFSFVYGERSPFLDTSGIPFNGAYYLPLDLWYNGKKHQIMKSYFC